MRRVVILLASVLVLASLGACRLLTETEDEEFCRKLNAFAVNTAQMQVGTTRQFEAFGSIAQSTTNPFGSGCSGVMRDGFQFSTDVPAVATVGATTGIVAAHSVGTTALRARLESGGVTYRGDLTLSVVP